MFDTAQFMLCKQFLSLLCRCRTTVVAWCLSDEETQSHCESLAAQCYCRDTSVSSSDAQLETKARFPLPELTARQHGPCSRVMETGHPSTRAVNSGRQLGQWKPGCTGTWRRDVSVMPRLHLQIHVAGYKYPGRATCIRLHVHVDGYMYRRIQVLSSVLLADTSGYVQP